MKIVEQSHEILFFSPEAEKMIEVAGRTCYKSEDKITDDSADKFCNMLKNRGHHSVIEHCYATVRFITNRGVTHELVRHRLASFSQESTRYVKLDGDMEFIRPVWCDKETLGKDRPTHFWTMAIREAEQNYQKLLEEGWRPEQAREVLPNSLKTEIVVTCNFREWLHIFNLRCAKAAHPQMRALMIPVREEFAKLCPAIFGGEE